jgi:hypothetical protein
MAAHEAQVKWLYDWWERIDTWITENRPGGAAAPEVIATKAEQASKPAAELSRPSAVAQIL